MLSLTRAPNLGTSQRHLLLCPNPASGTSNIYFGTVPFFPSLWHLLSHIDDSWGPPWGKPRRCLEL